MHLTHPMGATPLRASYVEERAFLAESTGRWFNRRSIADKSAFNLTVAQI